MNDVNNQINSTEAISMMKLNESNTEPGILPAALRAANMFNTQNKIGAIEVTTPISNMRVLCEPMASLDEITAKTITGGIQLYVDTNLELFYSACDFLDRDMSFNDFKSLPEADFLSIAYGVMKASFKNLNSSSFRCNNPKCTNPSEDKIFSFTPQMNQIHISFPKGGYSSPNNDYRKDLFISEMGNIVISYKFDSLEERVNIFKNKSNDEIRKNLKTIKSMVPRLEFLPLFIYSIKITDPETQEEIILTDKNDIMIFIHKLSSTSKEIIENSNDIYIEHITGYNPKFSAKIECPHCKHINDWEEIDLLVEFFLKISALY